ncbi:RNase P [Edwardsiella ictaluri]|nr:RNase P [Edwardsiella ictaluri]KOO55951.1 RNase P [Edwardsiella ictaluri]
MLTQTETFACQALDTVTLMSAFDMLFGDSKTDAGIPQRVHTAENGKLGRTGSLRLLEDEIEVIGS